MGGGGVGVGHPEQEVGVGGGEVGVGGGGVAVGVGGGLYQQQTGKSGSAAQVVLGFLLDFFQLVSQESVLKHLYHKPLGL